MLTNQKVEKIGENRIKELERFTRRLYIYRQKDRPEDKMKNGKGKGEQDLWLIGRKKRSNIILRIEKEY